MSLRSLLSIDFKKYIPGFILNLLSKLKYLFKIISPFVLFLTVISFWTLLGIVFLTDGFSHSEQPFDAAKSANLHLFSASNQSVYQMVGEARLGMDGENVKLLATDTKGQLGKVFLFQYNDGSIATTLSVENPNIASPSFRIVKGQSRDWLVVTTIENSGTGYLKHIDTWYVANSYYQGNLAVLSYPSDGYTYDIDGTLKQKLTTDASISADDKAIEIKFIFDICETQNKCTKTTKAAHYVWNSEKELFVLDEKKSEISALEISNL